MKKATKRSLSRKGARKTDTGDGRPAGDVVLRTEDSDRRSPYRLTGVFQRHRGKWLWKHFHGSEPAQR